VALRRHNGQSVVHPQRRTTGRVPPARAESISRISTSRFDQRTMGANGHPAGTFVFVETLRRALVTSNIATISIY